MSRRAPGPESLTAEPRYLDLKDHIIKSTGLAYYLDKDHELAEKIAKRLDALGIPGCSGYLDLLAGTSAGDGELDELVADLTIGETYFFRHEEQFDALRRVALPIILQRNRTRRQLRIWSAGCSTGAEAYSLSILLKREFSEELAGWDVSILGTDINRKFLVQAREGSFGDWTLRNSSEELKGSCFERRDGSWRIRDRYREGVSFQYHNLVKHPYPSLLHNLTAFDLILCRNVMIYFAPQAARDCVSRFHGSLLDDGWLLTGYAEMNPDLFHSFRGVSVPGAVLFQKGIEPDAAASGPAPAWRPPSLPELPILSQPLRADPAPPPAESAVSNGATARIRELADRAEWQAASKLCRGLIEKDSLDPLGHFYYALVLEQMGRAREAVESLDRAVYLDRRFTLAHYHKGLYLQKNRDGGGAAKSFENVLELLENTDPALTFPEADGITAADLAELARMQLEILEGT